MSVALCLFASAMLGCAGIRSVLPSPPPTPTATATVTAAPTSTPAPTPTSTPVLSLIVAAPRQLVLQRDDLPGGFELGGQESSTADEWSALYVRPEAIGAQYASLANLFSVITNVRVLPEGFQALQAYNEQVDILPTEIASHIQDAVGGSPEDVKVEHFDMTLPGADRAIGYRVDYRIGNVHLREYRYLLLSGNGVASLMLTALAEPDGSEPERLRELTEGIAAKQAERLLQARMH
jgi:hypothetical protein